MRSFRWGVVFAVVGGAAAVFALMAFGHIPVGANAEPGRVASWLMRYARHAAVERVAPLEASPIEASADNLLRAVPLYRDSCAGCHGTPETMSNVFAASLYPPAPQFMSVAQTKRLQMSDGELFVIIRDGYRMTGMPSFARMLEEYDIWSLVTFLKNLDRLSPEAQKALAKS